MTDDRPVVVDLYCKAGGMAVGLTRAGFRVIGWPDDYVLEGLNG